MVEGRTLEEVVFHRKPLDIGCQRFLRMRDPAPSFGILDLGSNDTDGSGRQRHRSQAPILKVLYEVYDHVVKFSRAL
jgi:hypothetical protein